MTRVDKNEVVVRRKLTGGVSRRISLLPYHRRYKIRAPEHLVHQHLEVVRFVVVNRDPDAAVLSQQFPQQHQTRIHHAQPLAVLQLVVVVLERRLRVVRRVDEDALHAPGIDGDQRLQRQQVVSLNQQILRRGVLAAAEDGFLLEQVRGHCAHSRLGLIFIDPIQKRHRPRPLPFCCARESTGCGRPSTAADQATRWPC